MFELKLLDFQDAGGCSEFYYIKSSVKKEKHRTNMKMNPKVIV